MSNFGLLNETDLIVISADYYVKQKPKNNELTKHVNEMSSLKKRINKNQEQMKDVCSNVMEMKKEMDDIKQMMR